VSAAKAERYPPPQYKIISVDLSGTVVSTVALDNSFADSIVLTYAAPRAGTRSDGEVTAIEFVPSIFFLKP